MKKIILVLVVSFSLTSFAQESPESISISGKVIEKTTNQPLEYATVTLQNQLDNKVINGAVTNSEGSFNIKTIAGNYNIKVEFMGLKSIFIENLDIRNNYILPIIFLEENIRELQTVEIKTEKSTLEYKLDKKIFNVGTDLVSKGGNANDILNNVPSVSVNTNGAVSLRGNASVRILINGKPSVLASNNGLEQIPSENIEKVEVITNPSSKYDSEGTAGIINIILKKNKISGWGSSVQITTGVPANNALGYNVSYKNKKINLFSDLRYQYATFLRDESSLRTNYINNEADSFLEGKIDRNRNNKTFNLYFGGDYYFNDKNTVTLSYYHRNNTSKNTANYSFNYLDKNKNFQRIVTATENYNEPQVANQIELNYIKTFNKEGQKFTVNMQYDFWNDDENESIVEQENFPVPIQIKTLKSRDIESSKDFLFQSDYTIPMSEKSKIEVGIKGEIRRINSDYEVYENAISIDSLNNYLRYNEQIFGAYFQYGSSIKKLSYLLGLRVENSNTGSTDDINQYNIKKKYTDLFPTSHLTYNFNDAFNLQLSYSRRISRPRFWQINPFGGIADRRNVRIGNPNLDPMYTDSYELSTLIKWKQFTINPSVYHQLSTNLFEDIRYTNPNGVLVEQSINSGTESRIGAELSISYSPVKWLTLSGEMNYFTFNQKGIYTVSDNAFTSKLNSRIKFSTWNLQTNFNYQGGRKSGQIEYKPEYWIDLGLAKDILKDKATITFKIDNALDSRISKAFVTGDDYTLDSWRKNIGPRIYGTFTYRFNRKKNEKERLPE